MPRSSSTPTKAAAAPKAAAVLIPPRPTLHKLREAAAGCTARCSPRRLRRCSAKDPAPAPLMLVGETPGDQEDLAGRPFVGPAGKLLDRCLADAGIDRTAVYVTNVVKHFKWEPRGKRRLHKKPNALEIRACKPWLEAEAELARPKVLVCLGATAAQAVLGPTFRVSTARGEWVSSTWADRVLATFHPSALLRAQDDDHEAKIALFIKDLRKAAEALKAAA